MNLSSDQIEAMRQGEAVRVCRPEIGADCVVVRADIYERVRTVLEDGLSIEQVGALIERKICEDDANDPLPRQLSAVSPMNRGDVVIVDFPFTTGVPEQSSAGPGRPKRP